MTMRTVLYARYSSDLQNERSTQDQLIELRKRCNREGWQVVDEFTDDAISGAAGLSAAARPGISALLERIDRGDIDQIFAESTDRLARHQGDAFSIFERASFVGARIFTLSDGHVSEITASIKGLMDARFRVDLGGKIKRGGHGNVRQGRSAGGLPYGYRCANRLTEDGTLIRGLRDIVPAKAEIIQRIFREYAAGMSPRSIVNRLNAEGVEGPRGGPWRAGTLTGDIKRQNGILQNRLYAGKMVYNRTSKVLDPRTRKHKIRPNPESEWTIENVGDLRIVAEELWQAVQVRRQLMAGQSFSKQQRPKRLLSGLGSCGCCGSRWIVIGNERWGCSSYRNGKGCNNARSVVTSKYEERVLNGLKHRMLDPRLIEIFVKEYHEESNRKNAEQSKRRQELEAILAKQSARIARLVEALADGLSDVAEVKEVLAKCRQQRAQVEQELAEIDALPIIALHPKIGELYRSQVERLTDTLTKDEETTLHARRIIRSLIDQVIVTPREAERGVNIEVSGRLASILALATGEEVPVSLYAAGGAGEGKPILGVIY